MNHTVEVKRHNRQSVVIVVVSSRFSDIIERKIITYNISAYFKGIIKQTHLAILKGSLKVQLLIMNTRYSM